MNFKVPPDPKKPISQPIPTTALFENRWERIRLFFRNSERFIWDISAVILLTIAVLTIIGFLFPGSVRGLLFRWTNLVLKGFGWGSIWIIASMITLGVWLLLKRRFHDEQKRANSNQSRKILWGRIFALELAAFSSLGIFSLLGGMSLDRAMSGLDGGIIGWGLVAIIQMVLKPIGFSESWLIGFFLLLLFIVGMFSSFGLWGKLKRYTQNELEKESASLINPEVNLPEDVVKEQPPTAIKKEILKNKNIPDTEKIHKEIQKKNPGVTSPNNIISKPIRRGSNLPGMELLELEQKTDSDEDTINEVGELIEKTLADFGIPVDVVGYRIGPTVIQYAVEPGFLEKENPNSKEGIERRKIRVAKIANLHRDLALALAVDRLRIEAPVPGRPYVGIEVPNSRVMIVRLRPLLESPAFKKQKSPLNIALGRDVSGQPLVTNLSYMPHLLVAGTTGSGKSVCIIALAVCLIMNNSPETLRLVMIDPKIVELRRFNGLPHLYGRVETEIKRILLALHWIVVEMDQRYKQLEASNSRDLDAHNAKLLSKGEKILPRIVVFIDELADLMLSNAEETEPSLIRLAQLARAVGIHLVIATQRPSAQVITGLIKANFPARIAFMVASAMDSRVILDANGADKLLGRGDMLFLPPDASNPVRSQGAMVTDQELDRVKAFWQKTIPAKIPPEPAPWDLMTNEDEIVSDRDGLIDRAIEIIQDTGRASTSLLQRKLRIGYPHAARLMEELEALGIVGPSQGGGRDREVLLGKDDEFPGIS